MTAQKSEPEKEPSKAGIYVMGLCLFVIGAFLASLFLLTIPAQAFSSVKEYEKSLESKEVPMGPMPNETFYFEGPVTRSRSWEVGRNKLLNGEGSVSFTAGELNGWLSSKFRPGKSPNADETKGMLIVPGTPNFFIEGPENVYVSLPTEIAFYGNEVECVFFAKGHFANNGSGVDFVIEQLNASSAGIPGVGILGNAIVNTLLGAYRETGEFKAISEAWTGLKSVEVVGDTITLNR